jgi:hypothetical protein
LRQAVVRLVPLDVLEHGLCQIVAALVWIANGVIEL